MRLYNDIRKSTEGFKELHKDIDKDNWLFVGTINPEMVQIAIDAIDYKIKKGEYNDSNP